MLLCHSVCALQIVQVAGTFTDHFAGIPSLYINRELTSSLTICFSYATLASVALSGEPSQAVPGRMECPARHNAVAACLVAQC
jgi:hypothetical protein